MRKKMKLLDRVILTAAMAVAIVSTGLVASATTYTSTLSLGAGNSFHGTTRSYTGNGSLKIQFTGSGSSGNNYNNVIEPYERILGFDFACGYRYVGTSANETWTNCPTGNYNFWFYNVGSTTWSSSNVTMSSW